MMTEADERVFGRVVADTLGLRTIEGTKAFYLGGNCIQGVHQDHKCVVTPVSTRVDIQVLTKTYPYAAVVSIELKGQTYTSSEVKVDFSSAFLNALQSLLALSVFVGEPQVVFGIGCNIGVVLFRLVWNDGCISIEELDKLDDIRTICRQMQKAVLSFGEEADLVGETHRKMGHSSRKSGSLWCKDFPASHAWFGVREYMGAVLCNEAYGLKMRPEFVIETGKCVVKRKFIDGTVLKKDGLTDHMKETMWDKLHGVQLDNREQNFLCLKGTNIVIPIDWETFKIGCSTPKGAHGSSAP
eukprot:TRINITY_DN805_c0_g3_i2.p1 TRINITY_DN805_c0_g3~~TRINITY_DN805_c0_g3_i2.p1  ORF type:complete len:298 (+),score=61.55 TRINITY_DN805_c0_g3_i2:283-1176(+)